VIAFVLLFAAFTEDSCGVLCSPEAIRSYTQLNALSGLTRRDNERAGFLIMRDQGRLDLLIWQAGEATEATYIGHIPTACVAVIHTHPVRARNPSHRDVQEAQRIGLPIVVITPDAITAAMPDGTTVQLLGSGWKRLAR